MSRDIVDPVVFVRNLRREASVYRSRLQAAEAEVRRITSESAEERAALIARADEMRERAFAAEARLEELI